ncbi:MAG: response regulator [Desulfobacterales bacterium]|jgi:CheY-like chemotaxis protein
MKDLILWVQEVEKLAQTVYEEAARIYSDDPPLKRFLEQNAREEAYHARLMGQAYHHVDSMQGASPVISFDESISKKVFETFADIKAALEARTLDKDDLIAKLVEAELSEWNDIFLYVVSFLKEDNGRFKYHAARLQAHVKTIEDFVATVPNHEDILRKVKRLPSVWVENLLIVDDNVPVAELLKALLRRSGKIDVAHNGQEAMQLIQENYYKLIISDVDMPVMNGLVLFQEAAAKYPQLKNRFLFITGDLSPEREEFFSQNRVPYLAKPFAVESLRKKAAQILLTN